MSAVFFTYPLTLYLVSTQEEN